MTLVIGLLMFSIGSALLGWLLVDSVADIEKALSRRVNAVDAGLMADCCGYMGWGSAVLAPILYVVTFILLGYVNYERLVSLWTHAESIILFGFFFVGILGCSFVSHRQMWYRAR